MSIILLDHDDSFTFILAEYFYKLTGEAPQVLNHNTSSLEEVMALTPTALILSPGPGTVLNPTDFKLGKTLIQHFEGKIPILGVCLGHQGIAAYYGAKIRPAKTVMHGKKSWIHHTSSPLFESIPNPFEAMRYHSLAVEQLPSSLEVIAQTEEGEIMALRHLEHPIFGVQFHPESIGTLQGIQIIRNFLKIASIPLL